MIIKKLTTQQNVVYLVWTRNCSGYIISWLSRLYSTM